MPPVAPITGFVLLLHHVTSCYGEEECWPTRGPVGEGTRCQSCRPEFQHRALNGKRREVTPASCFLTSTPTQWWSGTILWTHTRNTCDKKDKKKKTLSAISNAHKKWRKLVLRHLLEGSGSRCLSSCPTQHQLILKDTFNENLTN